MVLEISIALDIAKRAHARQVRKYTGEPYLVHPLAVAELVASVTDDISMFCAAILHDVVEDSNVSLEVIKVLLGLRVAELVDDLTDVSRPSDGNRERRKAIDRAHTAKACADAKTIKLADLIDNTRSIVAFAPKFAKIYMEEKKLLLNVLKEGDQTLYTIAMKLVNDYYRRTA